MSRVIYNDQNLTITLEGMEDVASALGALASKTPAAAKVAINSTAREARKLMIEAAKARYAVNEAGARHLKDLKMRRKATNTNLCAELFIAKMRNDLGYFEHTPTQTFTGAAVRHAPAFVRGHVLKGTELVPLSGTGNLSKGFLVEFKSGHKGMVQRIIGSDSKNTVTQKSGAPRWRNAEGKVEKLQTMGSPSATAMHNMVWPGTEPEVEAILLSKIEAQVEKVIDRAAGKG